MRVKTLLPLPLLIAALACGKKEAPAPPPAPAAAAPAPAPISVTSIKLANAIGADKKIAEGSSNFSLKDTIYASIETDGATASAKLEAKWTFTGSKGPVPIHDDSLDLVNVTAATTNEFHISKKTPWPKGAYQVEILLNGASAGKKDFSVK
jgi:hypothetical protein